LVYLPAHLARDDPSVLAKLVMRYAFDAWMAEHVPTVPFERHALRNSPLPIPGLRRKQPENLMETVTRMP
jgi:hypothetical protein